MHTDLVSTGYKENRGPDPHDVRLKDGSPLFYALLESDGAEGVLDKNSAQEAKSRLRERIAADSNAVLSCQGKTQEEARKILDSIDVGRKAS